MADDIFLSSRVGCGYAIFMSHGRSSSSYFLGLVNYGGGDGARSTGGAGKGGELAVSASHGRSSSSFLSGSGDNNSGKQSLNDIDRSWFMAERFSDAPSNELYVTMNA